MDSLFIWSYEDFLDGLRADYSDQGSIGHMAEVDCHKAFMDAMEEIFNTGKYFTVIYTLQPARCVNKLSLEVLVYCNTRLIDDIRVII